VPETVPCNKNAGPGPGLRPSKKKTSQAQALHLRLTAALRLAPWPGIGHWPWLFNRKRASARRKALPSRGRPKTKTTGSGPGAQKGLGSEYVFDLFLVFLNIIRRERFKNVIKNKLGFGFVSDLFVKTFRATRFFRKTFVRGVFEHPSLRTTRKRDKTKNSRENLPGSFVHFFRKSF
jgi:hypothetical protein